MKVVVLAVRTREDALSLLFDLLFGDLAIRDIFDLYIEPLRAMGNARFQ
jgi:hypothetical protein